MREKFDPAEFHRQEREIKDEMMERYSHHQEVIDDQRTEIVEFPNFRIFAQQGVGESARLLKILSGEKEFSLLSDLPEDHKLFLTFYPSAEYKHKKKELHIPHIYSRGALLSALHEFQHVSRRMNLSKQELEKLNEARTASSEEKSIEQKELILLEERLAWDGAKIKAAEIEDILAIKIFQDQDALESYIQRKFATYEKFL